MASGKTPGLTQEANGVAINRQNDNDVFDDMKQRFLAFKKHKYFYAQAPKCKQQFLVIACADSRVCPSTVLGFQPGDAFTVRNIANLVPSYESGPTETKAALEFSVNTLNVEDGQNLDYNHHYSFAPCNFLHRPKPMFGLEGRQEEEECGVNAYLEHRRRLPLFPMHGEDHLNGDSGAIWKYGQSNDRDCFSRDSCASLELRMN
ncbi:hypothetical protein ARALYDRAFT_894205 [Arabidopsis lyrata subsp. lyrata]|uniref:Carbonic anhydrase n=1 Tax=Arabidopsis lyrata subsp. lyrata TaxID=81972 RepID=D7KT17_ARALL|nr:hypothetical protein ARALYDRAFT_905389 [Arabidopsis lyrata subsp. lyrata]EFH63245.1 hypothetical protein ARALYDRAFT_894205 [Arabidopsis lyrata subsp. lyrata]